MPTASRWRCSRFTSGCVTRFHLRSVKVLPGTEVDFVIEYYSPYRITPNPTLRAELVDPASAGQSTPVGDWQPINRAMMLGDGTFMVEFFGQSDRTYYVQYTSDLKNWVTTQPSLRGSGTWIQWIDNGQPKTASLPQASEKRFYRVFMVP